jgi:drug/metabolite transporter (DMT)-like permease
MLTSIASTPSGEFAIMSEPRVLGAAALDTSSGASIACICAGAFFLAANDAIAKWLGTSYSVTEIVFFRMLFALAPIMAIGLTIAGRGAFTTQRPLVHLGRGLLATCGTFTFFFALTLLPLAETTAIAFTAPLFVTLLAVPILGERPGIRQWVATLVGFTGALLVVQPGSDAFAIAATIPLLTALSYALLMLSAGWLGRSESIWATMFYATLIPLILSAVVVPWYWKTPTIQDLPLFAAMGVCGGAAMTLITQAFRIGVASIVAPFDYTGLLWAVTFGWIFWGDTLSGLAAIGAMLIAICGVYLAYEYGRAGGPPTASQ